MSHPELKPPARAPSRGWARRSGRVSGKLGVTAIQLMPIQAFFDDRHLVEKGLKNYWGYNTIGFFVLAPRYLMAGGGIAEFKHMVQRLHEAGIEVILAGVVGRPLDAAVPRAVVVGAVAVVLAVRLVVLARCRRRGRPG